MTDSFLFVSLSKYVTLLPHLLLHKVGRYASNIIAGLFNLLRCFVEPSDVKKNLSCAVHSNALPLGYYLRLTYTLVTSAFHYFLSNQQLSRLSVGMKFYQDILGLRRSMFVCYYGFIYNVAKHGDVL